MAYSPEEIEKIQNEILLRIAEGESLRQICQDEHLPARATVSVWLMDDVEFQTKYARARALQADVMDEKIVEAAEDTKPENAAAQRVKIDAYKWRAERLNARVYGNRMDVTSGGEKLPAPAPTIVIHNETKVQSILAIAAARKEERDEVGRLME